VCRAKHLSQLDLCEYALTVGRKMIRNGFRYFGLAEALVGAPGADKLEFFREFVSGEREISNG